MNHIGNTPYPLTWDFQFYIVCYREKRMGHESAQKQINNLFDNL